MVIHEVFAFFYIVVSGTARRCVFISFPDSLSLCVISECTVILAGDGIGHSVPTGEKSFGPSERHAVKCRQVCRTLVGLVFVGHRFSVDGRETVGASTLAVGLSMPPRAKIRPRVDLTAVYEFKISLNFLTIFFQFNPSL